jgi:hypothetical protein
MIGIPAILLNNINYGQAWTDTISATLDLDNVDYELVLDNLYKLLNEKKITIPLFNEASTNILTESLPPQNESKSLGYMMSIYKKKNPTFEDQEYEEITLNNKFNDINELFNQIASYIFEINEWNEKNPLGTHLFSQDPEELLSHIKHHILLFKSFLQIRILLDELETQLRYRQQLFELYNSLGSINEINNLNLQNYIKENRSKLMRVLGEHYYIYTDAKLIVDYPTMLEIERIYNILNNVHIKTN